MTTIVIRKPQLEIFERASLLQFVDSMVAHLRRHFPARFPATVSDADLTIRVEEAIATARSLGLKSEQDCCRFLNFAGEYGWNFLQDEKTRWIHDVLADPCGGPPSARLDRAVQQALRRQEVERRNRELRGQFAPPEASSWKDRSQSGDTAAEALWDGDPLKEMDHGDWL